MDKYSLLQVTGDEHSTRDGLELGEAAKLKQLGVVLDSQVAVDLLDRGERDVGELVIANERDRTRVLEVGTNLRKILGGERLKIGVVGEAKSRNLLERGDVERANTAVNANVLGRLEDSHVDVHVLAVLRNDKLVANLGEIGVEHVKLLVGVDSEGLDGSDIEAAEVAETGVGNVDNLGLGLTTRTKVDLLKLVQGREMDFLHLLDAAQVDLTEQDAVGDVQSTANLGQIGTLDIQQLTSVDDLQITANLLDTAHVKGVADAAINSNISGDGTVLAGGGGRVCLDGDILALVVVGS